MATVNNNRPKRKPVPFMPKASGRDSALNKQSLTSGKAKIVNKNGKRLTLKSKDQKSTWLFVPKRGPVVVKNKRKA
jgi:hypothetical protein